MQKIKDFCKRHRLLWLYLTRETDLLTAFPRRRCGRVGRV